MEVQILVISVFWMELVAKAFILSLFITLSLILPLALFLLFLLTLCLDFSLVVLKYFFQCDRSIVLFVIEV